MAKLSVSILTFNEERNIGRCIESVRGIADEIVVLDSFSTDRTVEICQRHGVRVVQQVFLGAIEQRDLSMRVAAHDHVLCLDADETPSAELAASILAEKSRGFPSPGYTMNRLSLLCDTWIHHGTWYPDRKLRLVKRDLATVGVINPHERLQLSEGLRSENLRGDLLHYSILSIDEYVAKGNKYSTIAAKAMFDVGKRASLLNLLWNPFMAFMKTYVFRLGFLDGFHGYVIARQSAYQTFLKYAKLRQLGRS